MYSLYYVTSHLLNLAISLSKLTLVTFFSDDSFKLIHRDLDLLWLALVVFTISCKKLVDFLLWKTILDLFTAVTIWQKLYSTALTQSEYVIYKSICMDVAVFPSAPHVAQMLDHSLWWPSYEDFRPQEIY